MIGRFPAIYEDEAIIDCYKSHIEVLKMAKNNNWKNVMIIEDDFIFIDIDIVNNTINNFFNTFSEDGWNVLILGRNYLQDFTDIGLKSVLKVNKTSRPSCYLVNSVYYDSMIDNYEKNIKIIEEHLQNDKFYDKYLENFPNWYVTRVSLGYMQPGYSDISKTVVNYIEYDKTLSNDIQSNYNEIDMTIIEVDN